MNGCEHCGKRHLFKTDCVYFLHESAFMTNCAACGEVIPSGAPRQGGRFGNLYCDTECLAEGYERLFDLTVDGPTAGVEAPA